MTLVTQNHLYYLVVCRSCDDVYFLDFVLTDILPGNKRMVSYLQNASRKTAEQIRIWWCCKGQG